METIKIDIISVPFSGHLYPLLTLAAPLLKEKKYRIRVITGDKKIPLVESIGFAGQPILSNYPGKMEEIANTSMRNDVLGMLRQFQQVSKLLPEAIDELKQIWREDKPDIVVADFVTAIAGIVCEELEIPWITTIPTPFAIESRTTTPTYLGGWKPPKTILGKARDAVGRGLVHHFKRLAFRLFRHNLGKYRNFKTYDANGYERIYSPYSILALGMKELEFRDDFPPQLLWAGYRCQSFETVENIRKPVICHRQKSEESPMLSDKRIEKEQAGKKPSPKKVLLTCGTHLLWEKQRLIQMAKLLAGNYRDIQFLVSMGNREKKDSPPIAKAANVQVYEYLPYEEILPEVDYVIHHGGAGILYSCIEYGKPALIVPRDYDQFDYAVRAELAGVAKTCKKGDWKGLLRTFDELIRQEDWSDLISLQKANLAYRPTEALVSEMKRLLTALQ